MARAGRQRQGARNGGRDGFSDRTVDALSGTSEVQNLRSEDRSVDPLYNLRDDADVLNASPRLGSAEIQLCP
jgi:hypothetical protein